MNFLRNFARMAAFATVLAFALPILAGIASVTTAGIAEAAVVSSITVQGNERIEASTIRSYISIKPGVSFSAVDIDDSVKQLFSTGLFSDVNISQRGSTLIVVVVENQIVNTVIFRGNKKIKSNILVALVDTKARGVLTESQLQGDVQRIKDYYDHSGRSNATVETEVTNLANNRVDVVFIIHEGGRTGVKSISFVGNQAYADSRLRRVIQTRKTNWLSWLNRKDVYDPAKIDADKELLRRFYLQHGFADFRVLGADVDFDEDAGKYHVVFTVDEGTRYRFGDITIDSSIPGVDVKSLYHLVRIKKGRVFDAVDVERTIEDMTVELTRRGFAFAQVRPRGDRNYDNSTISITLLVDEGPRIYVERIQIFGNTKTRDYVIRREFELAEGDAYNRVLVDKAERRLRGLGFFKSVTITTEPGSTPDRVIINVSVTEDNTGSFQVGGGYSTSDGFVATVSLTEKNFLGRGQYLKVSYGLGTDNNSNDYSISFTDPYFLGYRVSAGFDLYKRNASASDNKPYDIDSIGGSVRLGLPITQNLDFSVNYKLAKDDYSNFATGATVYYPDTSLLTSSVGYGLTYSTIDNMQDPSNGLYMKFGQEFAGVGGDVMYLKSVADARYYHEIFYGTDIIGLVRLQGGNILGVGEDVRIADNFFKGGETIRGFAPYGIGARDASGGSLDGTPLGGKNYVAATAELQFPLPFMPPDFGLRGAVFADAGTLFGIDKPSGAPTINDDASIRSSVGASVLWASPFGLLRADFAQALTKESYDETQFFRFSAGTQF